MSKTNHKLMSFVEMWYKVNELSRKGYSQSQISLALCVNRATVHRYQSMSEADFNDFLHKEAQRHGCKLDAYRDFIIQELRDAPFLSSMQVLDHLKEHFPDLPVVSEKTVYNYVMRIREEEGIPKQVEPTRQMHKLPEFEYGEQAQVDWGEQWMSDTSGRRVKVWFFCMIMSRSRMRFVYFRNTPFTTKTTIYAHHLAFQFFGGMPRQVLYDQDRKMLVRENYGDYIQTEEFAKYVLEAGYEAVYAMAADPQTKGKVENLVKYVKGNFLRGRKYLDIDSLNEQGMGWLARTANAKVHATTKLVPAEVFEEERKHLAPYRADVEEPGLEAKPYAVRSDNTILYRSNTYSLPLGTYDGKGTKRRHRRAGDIRHGGRLHHLAQGEPAEGRARVQGGPCHEPQPRHTGVGEDPARAPLLMGRRRPAEQVPECPEDGPPALLPQERDEDVVPADGLRRDHLAGPP